MQIVNWYGEEERFDQKVYDILGVDDSILANYRSSDGKQINLYIGFYESQRQGDIIHSPRNCMPGSGWNVADVSYEMVADSRSESGEAKVIKLRLVKGAEKQIMLYWFHSRGRIISSEYWQKIYLVLDAFQHNRTDGSFVRLTTTVRDGNEEAAVETLKEFAHLIMPLLNEYIPS
jgi:EpsI family protein